MRYFFNPGNISDVLVPHVKSAHIASEFSNDHEPFFSAIVSPQIYTFQFLYAIRVKCPFAIRVGPCDAHVMPKTIWKDFILHVKDTEHVKIIYLRFCLKLNHDFMER